MNKIVISIIIPVFNAKEYLHECLASIKLQTFENWECICVDDGSTDESQDIVNEYVSKDSRFRLIQQANAGPGVARNSGLEVATGEYFTFVDADDLVHPQMLEKLLDFALSHDADLVSCEYFRFESNEEFQIIVQNLAFLKDRVNIEEFPLLPKMVDWKKYRGHPVGKLYQKSRYSKLRFPSLYGAEDAYLSFDVYSRTQKAVFVKTAFYGYRTVVTSLTNSEVKYRNYMTGDAAVAIHCEELCREQGINKAVIKQLFMTYVMRIFHYTNEMAIDERVPKNEKKELLGVAKKGLQEIKKSFSGRYSIVPLIHFISYVAIQMKCLWILALWQQFKISILRKLLS